MSHTPFDEKVWEEARASTDHPGFFHSGSISDGSMVTCLRCGVMVDCHEPDETPGHMRACKAPDPQHQQK